MYGGSTVSQMGPGLRYRMCGLGSKEWRRNRGAVVVLRTECGNKRNLHSSYVILHICFFNVGGLA